MVKEVRLGGDVTIHQLYLSSLDANDFFPIMEQVSNIDIYESILAPIFSGTISINDSIGLREKFILTGGQTKLTISFSSPGAYTKPRKFEFLVTDLQNLTMGVNAGSSTYELVLFSIEIANNANQLKRTPMQGLPIDQYIQLILSDNIKTKKFFFYDYGGTRGIQDLSMMGLKPFQVIDMLKQSAVSKSNASKSSVYVFYENRSGFNFVPIELLLTSPKKLIGDGIYFFDNDSLTSVKNMTYKNILAYRQIAQDSTNKLIADGGMRNVVNSVNINTRQKTQVTHNVGNLDGVFSGTNDSRARHNSATKNSNNKNDSQVYNLISNSTSPRTHSEFKIGSAKAFIAQLTQNILRIMVYGDTGISAGFRINVRVPAAAGTTTKGGKGQKPGISEVGSGEFLISHVRHMIQKSNLGFKYYVSMELVNPSFNKGGGLSNE